MIGTVFLNHNNIQSQMDPYRNSARLAAEHQKPLIMFETNTASCGGFAGFSNTYGSAQWSVDYALTLAFGNFSAALWHVGGQNDYYNVRFIRYGPLVPPAN